MKVCVIFWYIQMPFAYFPFSFISILYGGVFAVAVLITIIAVLRCRKLKPKQMKSERDSRSAVSLCDPMNYTVDGILQARILEW